MRVLMPLPSTDFDPTESGVPWSELTGANHTVVFATPDGAPAAADERMLTGDGLGWPRPFLVARRDAIVAYESMTKDEAFAHPMTYDQLAGDRFDAIVLPGGHAPGMKPYLEAEEVQACVASHMMDGKIIAAICHGVLVVARSKIDGEPVLRGRKTTALTKRMEMSAWRLTKRRLGDYYRTYPTPVQEEVTEAVGDKSLFAEGHGGLRGFFEKILPLRDSPSRLARGFVVRDGNYISSRWPGDAYAFSAALVAALANTERLPDRATA